MATHVQSRIRSRQPRGIVEGVAIGHQRGRSQDSVPMRFDDPLVHIGGESEVIRIDYQPLQNNPSLIRRNFLGLARTSFNSDCVSRETPFKDSYNCGFTSNCPIVPCPALSLSTVPLRLLTS